MSTRSQALQAPSADRHEWQLLVAGLVAMLVVFVTLVVLATVNAPSKSTTVPPGTRSVGHSQDAGRQWDAIAGQAVGVALAVPALVVVPHAGPQSGELLDR